MASKKYDIETINKMKESFLSVLMTATPEELNKLIIEGGKGPKAMPLVTFITPMEVCCG